MREITDDVLKKLIKDHKYWLETNDYNWKCSRANLANTNLVAVNLIGAILSDANLSRANLSRAILRGANLYNTKLLNVLHLPNIPLVCPEKGSFIGYKKGFGYDNFEHNYTEYIVELEILASSRRSSATTRKCRCDSAKVLSITNVDGSRTLIQTVHSRHNFHFKYTIGEIVTEPNFCTDRFKECAEGIHFFLTRQEEVEY